MTNAAVLPVPDWACIMTSRPARSGIIARCWIGDGFSNLSIPDQPVHLIVDRILTHRHKHLWVGFPSVPFCQNWCELLVRIDYYEENEKADSWVTWPKSDSNWISWSILRSRCLGTLRPDRSWESTLIFLNRDRTTHRGGIYVLYEVIGGGRSQVYAIDPGTGDLRHTELLV